MAQARRIKSKKPKKARRFENVRSLPWGLLTIILAASVVIFTLINGAQQEGSNYGQGLRAFWEASKFQPVSEEAAIESLIKQKSTPKEFDFYIILPNIEQIMPDDLPDAVPTRAPENLDYFLQAASFRSYADAEKLRAQLALKGFVTITQKRSTTDNGDFYRVRLGPFADKRKAKTQKNKLQKLGVKPIIFTVKKES